MGFLNYGSKKKQTRKAKAKPSVPAAKPKARLIKKVDIQKPKPKTKKSPAKKGWLDQIRDKARRR